MRGHSAILLALAVLATDCDSPVEPVGPPGPGLPLKLFLGAPGPSNLSLLIVESGSRVNLGYRIPGSAKMVENEIVVTLENRIEPPKGYRLPADGPATFRATLPVEMGIYDLAVSFDGRMDRYQIMIGEERYRLLGPHGSFTTYPGTATPRG